MPPCPHPSCPAYAPLPCLPPPTGCLSTHTPLALPTPLCPANPHLQGAPLATSASRFFQFILLLFTVAWLQHKAEGGLSAWYRVSGLAVRHSMSPRVLLAFIKLGLPGRGGGRGRGRWGEWQDGVGEGGLVWWHGRGWQGQQGQGRSWITYTQIPASYLSLPIHPPLNPKP